MIMYIFNRLFDLGGFAFLYWRTLKVVQVHTFVYFDVRRHFIFVHMHVRAAHGFLFVKIDFDLFEIKCNHSLNNFTLKGRLLFIFRTVVRLFRSKIRSPGYCGFQTIGPQTVGPQIVGPQIVGPLVRPQTVGAQIVGRMHWQVAFWQDVVWQDRALKWPEADNSR